MADLFLSYASADRGKAAAVAAALEEDGRTVEWMRRAAEGSIEAGMEAARVVLVLWSAAARDSPAMRAEASEALDQGKILQMSVDGAVPPLPFAMLPWLDLQGWDGARDQAPWPQLQAQLELRLGMPSGGARHSPAIHGPDPDLQGYGRVAWTGSAALAVTILLCLAVLMASRRLISAGAFGAFSVAAALVAAGLLVGTGYFVLRTEQAGRR